MPTCRSLVDQHARVEDALRVHAGLGGLQHLAVQRGRFLLIRTGAGDAFASTIVAALAMGETQNLP